MNQIRDTGVYICLHGNRPGCLALLKHGIWSYFMCALRTPKWHVFIDLLSLAFDTEKEIQLQHIKDLGSYNSVYRADTNLSVAD